ncbi:MAG: O-antigen ligase family protein [Gemmatimonadetes bacterium]|nr:O-antigen ligase family protein [Gemmatimonadota bacterium]
MNAPGGRAPRRDYPDELSILAVTAAGLVVLQGYVPLPGQLDITLWQLFLALAIPAMLVLGLPPADAFRRPPFVGLLLLLVVTALIAPTSSGGEPAIRTVVFVAITISAYLVGYKIGVGGRLPILLRVFLGFAAPFAVLNVVFFAVPWLELSFLSSPGAKLLIEPNTLEGLADASLANNVLDPGKAGTLFVNTNIASILFGFGLCVCLYRMSRRPGLGRGLMAALFTAAFLATGSRAGIAAAVGTAVTVGLVVAWRLGAVRALKWTGIGGLVGAFVLSLPMSRSALVRIASLAVSGDPRILIWAHAGQLLARHPIRGVGFHGWGESFPPYARAIGLDPTLPPHNAYLIAWLWLGIAGLATMAVIFVGTIVSFARLTAKSWLLDLGLLGVALTSWFGIQLFFTNFALLQPRVGGAFCLLVGAAYGAAEYRRLQIAKASGRVQEHLPAALRGVDPPQSTGSGEV